MQKSKAAAQAATQAIHFLCFKCPFFASHIIRKRMVMIKQDNYSQSTGAQQGSSVSEALESSELCKVAHLDEGQRVYQVLP